MDTTTLFNTIQLEYTQFESLIVPLSEAQICAPSLDGGWSIKDIMAHTAAWERICTGWLEEMMQGKTPQPSELDENVNEQIYQENRDLSLEEAQAIFQQTHQQFLHQLSLLTQSFSEEDLNTPQRFAWTEDYLPGESLLAVITNNSYEHYQNHTQQIQRWLDASE